MKTSYSFRETLIEDLRGCHLSLSDDVGTLRLMKHTIYMLLMRHNFACVFLYRLNVILVQHFPLLAEFMAAQRYYIFANDISPYAQIGPGLRIHHTSDIVIGRDVKIGRHADIYNGVTIGNKSTDRPHDMPEIGDRVLISTGAKVLGKITIGDDVVIGALSLCNKSVPSHTVMYGIPPNVVHKPKTQAETIV